MKEEPPEEEGPKQKRLPNWLRVAITFLVCCLGISAVVVYVLQDKLQSEMTRKQALQQYFLHKKFISADGQKSLQLTTGDTAKWHMGSKTVSVKYALLPSAPKSSAECATFQAVAQGVVDQDGTMLYEKGAPELVTAREARRYAQAAQDYMDQLGHYPEDIMDLKLFQPDLIFRNPCTNQVESPALTALKVKQEDQPDLRSDAESYKLWSGEPNLSPGSVHGCNCSAGTEQMFLIHMCDRQGKLLSSSTKDKAFVIVLKNGLDSSLQSESEEDLPESVAIVSP
jgi:hypothetical protein